MKPILFFLSLIIFSSCGERKFIPEHGMVEIADDSKNIELAKGQQAYYQAREHGSVGIKAKLDIENEDILSVIKTHEYHSNPNWKNQDGGDAATITFVLQGRKKGTTNLKIRHLYHGNFQREEMVTFTVQ